MPGKKALVGGVIAAALASAVFLATRPSSTPRSADTLAVDRCRTTYGVLLRQSDLPKSPPATVNVDAAVDPARVSAYADRSGLMIVLGPAGWSCSATINADGQEQLVIQPPEAGPLPDKNMTGGSSQAVTGVETSACESCIAYLVCGFFPEAEESNVLSDPCPVSRPAEETAEYSKDGTVRFEDPTAVLGSGWPSGGAYSAIGALLYRRQPEVTYQFTCTLSESDLCAGIISDAVIRYG